MPISADQWRAVTGLNNTQRPRQLGLKQRFMQQGSQYEDSEKLSHHPESEDTTELKITDVETESCQIIKSSSSKVASTPGKGFTGADVSKADICKPAWFNTSSIPGVQLLTSMSFISLVVLLLLISAGDVETNPGPGTQTPEYLTIVDCMSVLKLVIKSDPESIATSLFSAHLISDGVYQSSEADRAKKASDLVDTMKDRIRMTPSGFQQFVRILKEQGPWTDDLVSQLETTYNKFNTAQEHTNSASPRRLRSQVTPTDKTIDEIARHDGIDPGQLDVPCAQSHLLEISKLLVYWKAYCRHLGLNELEEHHIQCQVSVLPHQKPLDMLNLWQKKTHADPKSHYRHLMRGCIEIQDNKKLVGDICKIIVDNPIEAKQIQSFSNEPRSKKPKMEEVQPKEQAPQAHGSKYKDPVLLQPEMPKTVDPENLVTQEVELPFCVILESSSDILERQSSVESTGPQSDAAGAQMGKDKMWPEKYDTLHVYFMNPDELTKHKVGLNTLNIMEWAKYWERDNSPHVPKFRETNTLDMANVRVSFQIGEGSETYVGCSAISVLEADQTTPTMKLGLGVGQTEYNRHIVIHEFGHALGLQHEHQRSCFWNVASKYIDVPKMKKDLRVSDGYFKRDYQEVTEVGPGSPEYDPDSVMHYWFRIGWLKNKKYHTLNGLRGLNAADRKVLEGIHKRHEKLAEKPSSVDYSFLTECYASARGPPIGTIVPKGSSGASNFEHGSQLSPVGTIGNNSLRALDSELDGPGREDEAQAKDPSIKQVIEEITSIAHKMSKHDTVDKLGSISDSLDSRCLQLGVVGTTSSGKSTTLNALLGTKYLPTYFKPHTARVVCIKHVPDSPAVLLEKIESEPTPIEIASGEDDICKKLFELNKKRRLDLEVSTQPEMAMGMLELRTPVHFLSQRSDLELEIYDTPGTSEAGNFNICKDAEHARANFAGIILVLSTDSARQESAARLLGNLKSEYPLLMDRTDKRILVLVNKYDLMFGYSEPPSLEEEGKELAGKIDVPPGELVFFSAELGFKAKRFKSNPASVNKDEFDKAHSELRLFPDNKQVQLTYSQENVKQLGSLLETSSRITEVEGLLERSCSNFRVLKVIDDTNNQVTELTAHAQSEIGEREEMKARFEKLNRQILQKFPMDVEAAVSLHLDTLVTALTEKLNDDIGRQMGTLGAQRDKSVVSQQIALICLSMTGTAEQKISESFDKAIESLQATLGSKTKQTLCHVSQDWFPDDELEEPDFDMCTFLDATVDTSAIKQHESITSLQSHITSRSVTKPRTTNKKTHSTEENQSTVYEVDTTAFRASFQAFAQHCGEFLHEKVLAVHEEKTRSIAHKAAENLLKKLGQLDWKDWIEDGKGQIEKCDREIEDWQAIISRLHIAEQKLNNLTL